MIDPAVVQDDLVPHVEREDVAKHECIAEELDLLDGLTHHAGKRCRDPAWLQRGPIKIPSTGGVIASALKKLSDARSHLPSGATVETSAIGRGTTSPMSRRYICAS